MLSPVRRLICLSVGHSLPNSGISTPGMASSDSINPTAAFIRIGTTKILRLVASRRNPAASIGKISMLLPLSHAAMACSSHPIAGSCWG